MTDEIFGIDVEGEIQEVSLEALAGFDVTAIAAVHSSGFTVTPEGIFEWRITGAMLDPLEWKNKKTGDPESALTVVFDTECIACRQCKDNDTDPADLVGITHQERFFIKDLIRDVGNVKAFMADMGMQGEGKFGDLLDKAVGLEFVCSIKHRKNKDDPDRPYANIDMTTVGMLTVEAAPAVPAVAPASPGINFGAPAT